MGLLTSATLPLWTLVLVVLLLSRSNSFTGPSAVGFVEKEEEEEEEEETPGRDGLGVPTGREALGSLASPPRSGVGPAL